VWTKIGQYECVQGVAPTNINPKKLHQYQKALDRLASICNSVFGYGYIMFGDPDKIGPRMERGRMYRYTIERLDPDETTVEIKVDGKTLARKTKGAKA
jgi:hypothetical protein